VNIADTRAGSSAPKQAYSLEDQLLEIGLRSGMHTITARVQDKTLTWEVLLTPGKTFSHEFRFNEPAAEPVAEPTAAPEPAPAAVPEDQGVKDSGSSLGLYGYITAGVGGAALIGGVVTGLMTKSKEKEAQDMCIDSVCPESAEDKFDSADSMALITNVLFIGGGVLAATGVTLIILDASSDSGDTASNTRISPKAPRLALSPLVTNGGAGLAATGAF
jgi:hypothetical protein